MCGFSHYNIMEARKMGENEKHELMKSSQISLWLEDYEDIFSDFDSRPYSERALSGDFLHEAKNASRDKPSGGLELRFLIPKNKRDQRKEMLIRSRLLDHFGKHHRRLHKESRKVVSHGIIFMIAGVTFMLLASILMPMQSGSNVLSNFLFVLLQPGGWFFLWEGLKFILFESKRESHDLSFYDKMTRCSIIFLSY
jgi:hypothetical protein